MSWHSGLRNSFLGTANFFTFDVLRLRRGTLAARYVNLFLVFGISGVFHMSSDMTWGVTLADSVEHEFFLMQAVGITIEDFVEWVYRVVGPRRRPDLSEEKKTRPDGGRKGVETWQRLMGYFWVLSWLVFTTPRWSYQRMRIDAEFASTDGTAVMTPDSDQLFLYKFMSALQAKGA